MPAWKKVMTNKIKENQPSRFTRWLVKKIFQDKDEVKLGDFIELYTTFTDEKGRFQARLRFWSYLIRSIPKYLMDCVCIGGTVFKNYLKTSLRYIRSYKGYTFINILGLVVGLTCFILIMLYVQFELSFDNFHENKDRIYRVIHRSNDFYMGSNYFSVSPAPLAEAMMEDMPEVQYASCACSQTDRLLTNKDKKFYESGIIADENFLNIFSFKLLRGDKSSLSEPNTIYLTEKLAKKYFGQSDPLNKIIKYNDEYELTIKGLLDEVPHNSHIQFNFIVSLKTWMNDPERKDRYKWRQNLNFHTYFLVKDGIDYKILEPKVNRLIAGHSGNQKCNFQWIIEPMTYIHLHTNYNFDWAVRSDIKYLYILSTIGFVILLIACINYMNLATAYTTRRAREIGIRKVAGAKRSQLIRQFLSESIFLSFLSAFVSVVAVVLLIPVVNRITGLSLSFNLLNNGYLLPGILFLVFFTGLISGSYPALTLSSFSPVNTLKRGLFFSSKGTNLRNFLVVLQFCIAVILMTGTIVIYRQLLFIKTTDMGYKKDHIVVVRSLDENVRSSYDVIKTELLQNPYITGVTRCTNLPMSMGSRTVMNFEDEKGDMEENLMINYFSVGYDYLDLFGMEVITGRDFSREITSDETEGCFIVNEEAVQWLGWKNPIGKRVDLGFEPYRNGRVIGVVKNFNYMTLHKPIEPAIIWLRPSEYMRIFAVRIRPENLSGTFNFINEKINAFTEMFPASVSFMDDMFSEKYRTEQNLGKMISILAGIAIFISCLGLFGLASFAAERRTKELGVRKVLGATISGIFILLTRGFTKLIIIANLIAWPVAFYLMNKWLQNFAYKIDLNVWPFVISGILAFLIALLTVSYQSVKASTANPVDSLRYE